MIRALSGPTGLSRQDERPDWRAGSPAPAVTAIVCTRERPQLLQRAVTSILAQDYAGPVQCVVVFDQSEISPIDLASLPPGAV